MNLSLSRKAFILVTVPVLFEIIVAGVSLQLIGKVEEARKAEAHARDLALHLNTILSLHMQRVSYAFLAQHSSEDSFANRLKQVRSEREAEARYIDELVAGDKKESARWGRMRVLFQKVEKGLDDVVDFYKNDQRALAAIKFARLQGEVDEIFKLGTDLARRQRKNKEESHLVVQRYSRELELALKMSVVGSVVLAFALATYFNRGTSSRLRTIMRNTQRLAAGLEPDRTVSGKDELATIDRTFHDLHDSLTQLRRKERAILDYAADAIFSIDEDFSLADVNQAAGRLWIYEANDLVGRKVVELVVKEEQTKVYDLLKDCLARELTVSFETRAVKKDGTLADIAWTATGSKAERSIFCVVHDVSKERQAERLKRDFIAMISHDLRTPLTSIQMILSMLEIHSKNSLTADLAESVSQASNNAKRVMTLVNNLLDLDRIESGNIDILPCAETMQEIVDAAIETISAIARQRRIELKNLVDDEIEVFADRERITQVLVNLLGNALKFSPDQSSVTIAARREGDEVTVSVIDRGRGVPEELEKTIFDRFKQAEPGDQRVQHGTGLGLAICKAIVERHHGEIGVKSNQDGGSIFWFTLPVHGELPD